MRSTSSKKETKLNDCTGRFIYASQEAEDLHASRESSQEVTGKEEEEATNNAKNIAANLTPELKDHSHGEKNLWLPEQAEEVTCLQSEQPCSEVLPIENCGTAKKPLPKWSSTIKRYQLRGQPFRPVTPVQCPKCISCGDCQEVEKVLAPKPSRKRKTSVRTESPVPWQRACPFGGTGTLINVSSSSMTSTGGSSLPRLLNLRIVIPKESTTEEEVPILEVNSLYSPVMSNPTDGGPTFLPNGMLHYKGG